MTAGQAPARSNPVPPGCGAEIARAVYGVLFDYSTEALFIVDRSTACVVSANVRVADLLARDVDAVIGARFDHMVVDTDHDVSSPGLYEDIALRRADDYRVYVTLFGRTRRAPPDLRS